MRPALMGTAVERRLALRDRIAAWRKSRLVTATEAAAMQTRHVDELRQVGPLARVALFVLTLFAFSAAMSMVMLIGMPIMMAASGEQNFLGLSLIQGVISCFVGIVGAELLMASARLRRTGIEDALYLSGPFGLLLALVPRMQDVPPVVFPLLAAGIFAVVGVRLRRGLWLAASAACIALAAGVHAETVFPFTVACVAIGVVAALAGARSWRSPAAHLACSIVAALFPAIGLAARFVEGSLGSGRDVGLAGADLGMGWLIVAIAFAGFLQTRWKALLYSSLLTLLVLIVDAVERVSAPAEWVAMGVAAVTVIVVRVVHQSLAGRTSGLTSEPLAASELEELEPLGGAAIGAAVAPHHTSQPHTGPVLDDAAGPTDSSFGGGGATEKY